MSACLTNDDDEEEKEQEEEEVYQCIYIIQI